MGKVVFRTVCLPAHQVPDRKTRDFHGRPNNYDLHRQREVAFDLELQRKRKQNGGRTLIFVKHATPKNRQTASVNFRNSGGERFSPSPGDRQKFRCRRRMASGLSSA